MHRLGVALIPHRDLTMADYIRLAQLAEQQGYESLWAGESHGLELFTWLGVLLSHTSRIKVAPGIASIFTRTPTLMTMAAATLHAIAPHRTILGLGVSTRIIVGQWHGLVWDQPLERTAEYLQVLRQGLRGERLMHQGTYYHAEQFRLGVEAPGREALQSISDRMVEALGVIGTAEVCRTRLRQFAEVGITLPIVLPFTPEAAAAQGYLHTIGALAAPALAGYGILR